MEPEAKVAMEFADNVYGVHTGDVDRRCGQVYEAGGVDRRCGQVCIQVMWAGIRPGALEDVQEAVNEDNAAGDAGGDASGACR